MTTKCAKIFAKNTNCKPLMTENEISNKVLGIAIDVHKQLGPGLLESAYKECLYYKINKSGLFVEKEKAIPLIYDEVRLECGYRKIY